MRRLGTLPAVGFVAALAAACGRETGWPPEPAEVHLGEDACAQCRMIVSDGRFAAQARTRAGETWFFDDLGCLLRKAKDTPVEPEGVFVRAFDADAWVRGDRGFALHAADLATPMGSGRAVLATREAAEAEAKRHPGAVVSALAEVLRNGAAAPIPPESPR